MIPTITAAIHSADPMLISFACRPVPPLRVRPRGSKLVTRDQGPRPLSEIGDAVLDGVDEAQPVSQTNDLEDALDRRSSLDDRECDPAPIRESAPPHHQVKALGVDER